MIINKKKRIKTKDKEVNNNMKEEKELNNIEKIINQLEYTIKQEKNIILLWDKWCWKTEFLKNMDVEINKRLMKSKTWHLISYLAPHLLIMDENLLMKFFSTYQDSSDWWDWEKIHYIVDEVWYLLNANDWWQRFIWWLKSILAEIEWENQNRTLDWYFKIILSLNPEELKRINKKFPDFINKFTIINFELKEKEKKEKIKNKIYKKLQFKSEVSFEKFYELWKKYKDINQDCLWSIFNLSDDFQQWKFKNDISFTTLSIVKQYFNEKFKIIKEDFSKEEIKLTFKNITKKLVWQDEIIKSVLMKIFVNKKLQTKPVWNYMFLWPTWVWKTEFAKQIALELYGDEKKHVLLAWNEMKHSVDVYKVLWSNPWFVWFGETTTLADKINKIKEWVLIIDEIEKAHPTLQEVLLKAIEDWFIEMWDWTFANLSNFVIIMTSNLIQNIKQLKQGTELIWFQEKINKTISKKETNNNLSLEKNLIIEELKNEFLPEFLWRFDEFYVFNQLNSENLKDIFKMNWGISINQLKKKQKELWKILTIKEDEINQIVKEAKERKLWWRYIKKQVQNKISEKTEKLFEF